MFWCVFATRFCFLLPFDTVVTSRLMATIIAWLVANPASAAPAFLWHPPAVLTGVLSCSIYLWQQLFLGPCSQWRSIPAIVLAASASYALIERPFLALRDRWSAFPESGAGETNITGIPAARPAPALTEPLSYRAD